MTPPWIADLESTLGATLPDDLRALYERADGETDFTVGQRPMRLLSSAEALDDFRTFIEISDLRGSCPFWIGDNGDRAAAFVSGPLRGRIYFWEHITNYPSEPVAYRSTESFVETMSAAANDEIDWYEMPTDYLVGTSYYTHGPGIRKPATPEAIESDRTAFEAMLAAYRLGEFQDEYDERFYAAIAIALAPPDENEAIVTFLNADDMYVQEYACKELAHRRYEPAVERLGRLAREMRGNGQTSAIAALGKIATAEAREEILRSVGSFQTGHDFWLAQSLQATGCEIRFEEDKFRSRTYFYRLPGDETWRTLR